MVRHLCLVRPAVFRSEDSFQTTYDTTIGFYTRISLFYSYERFHESLPHVLRHFTNILPMSTIRDADDKLFGLHIGIFLTAFTHELTILLIIYIRNTLKEQQRENVFFVTGSIYLTTQTCSRSPQELLHFIERDGLTVYSVFLCFCHGGYAFISFLNSSSAFFTASRASINSFFTSS